MNKHISGDLFAIDKRLSLKGIKDLNKYLEDAFLPGNCICSRCKENGGIEQDYEFDHTFTIGGSTVRRVFSSTKSYSKSSGTGWPAKQCP